MRKKIVKLLNHKSETIFGAGLLTAFFSLLSGLLGMLRNALLAWRFGASGSLDVYYASFRLPDLIYNIFIMGALAVAFIPVFSSFWQQDKEKAKNLVRATIMLIGGLLGIMGVLVIIFARPLLSKLLIGFNEEKLRMAVILTRIMMIQPILLGISAIISSVLRYFKLFFVSAVAPLMYNLGIIAGIVFLVPLYGLPGLAYGVVLGAIGHLLIQLPSFYSLLHNIKFSSYIWIEVKSGLKKMLSLMAPRLLGVASYQIFLVGLTAIATLLKEGSLAIFNFAVAIQNLPQNIFVLSFSLAAFPRLAEFEAQGRKSDFSLTFWQTLSQILFFILPLAVWIFVFREPVVRLLLGYGKFTWQATQITIQVLGILIWGMIFAGINLFLLRVFFAKKNTLDPLLASLIAYSFGLYLCYYISSFKGVQGLALGVVITNLLNFLFLTFLLKKRLKIGLNIDLIKKTGIILLISCLSVSFGYFIYRLLLSILSPDRVINLALNTALSLSITGILYLYFSFLMKIEEVQFIKDFWKKLSKRR